MRENCEDTGTDKFFQNYTAYVFPTACDYANLKPCDARLRQNRSVFIRTQCQDSFNWWITANIGEQADLRRVRREMRSQ